MATTKFGLAQPVRRVEDPRLLRGMGRYTDDIVLPGMLHGIVVRSPHAAATILSIDFKAAAALPGVHAIYTAADLKAAGLGTLPCAAPVQNRDGTDMAAPAHPALAEGAVHHVGDPVAFIVADTAEQARDAAELMTVDYDVQPSATDLATTMNEGAPAVWPGRARNGPCPGLARSRYTSCSFNSRPAGTLRRSTSMPSSSSSEASAPGCVIEPVMYNSSWGATQTWRSRRRAG